MRINTNLTAMNTYSQYTKNNSKIASSVAKLSSGYAINTAADNAAGLAISEKMRAQIRGLDKSSSNAQDAISLVQTAEGALSSSTEILQRMREIAVQSASDTNENEIDRTALQDEFAQLQSELNDISSNTTFNKKNLLDGSLAASGTSLSNVNLEKAGLSVELGNAVAGSYTFSVGVQQESAAVTGVQSNFTGTSSDSAFTVGTVTNSLSASSLANGNYTIQASYDEANKQMTFTATNNNDTAQTFTATLNASELSTSFGDATAATLTFKNGSTTAFSFDVTAGSAYDTTSATTMSTLASSLSDALTLSATGGVDAQAATYGVYASLTGAESVKLEAGMDSVSFSNGVKVNFNELSTSSVSTSLTTDVSVIAPRTSAAVTNNLAGAGATASINLSDIVTAGQVAKGAGTAYSVSINGSSYSYTQQIGDDADAIMTGLTAAINGTKPTATNTGAAAVGTPTLTFTATATPGSTTLALASQTAAGAGDLGAAALTVSGSSGSYNYAATFGGDPSTFDVVSEAKDGLTFQVGANEGDTMSINIDKMDANQLGVSSASVGTQAQASDAISTVDKAINKVSAQRATLGAIQNRLEYKISNLETSTENLTSAESQIRDVDMAKEMTKFTNANILNQAATAMLAQANSLPQGVLSLIGG